MKSFATPHPRLCAAHCPPPATAPGAAQACPGCLPCGDNQLIRHGDWRLCRRIERAVRSASVPSQLGAEISLRPASQSICDESFLRAWRICAAIPPICHYAAGASGFPAHPVRFAQIGSPAGVMNTSAAHFREPSASLHVPRQIGGYTPSRPAVLSWPIPAPNALMSVPCSGRQGRRPLAPPFLTGASHQRHLPDSLGCARPFVPSLPFRPDTRRRTERFGAFTCDRPAFSPQPHPASEGNPLICGVREVWPGLRPLAQTAFAEPANQHTRFDFLISARPFLPSSLSSKPRLRAERNGGLNPLDLLCGVPENLFPASLHTPARASGLTISAVILPGPNDRQDSTFPRKVRRRAAGAHFPAIPPRVRRAPEGVSRSLNPHPTTRN